MFLTIALLFSTCVFYLIREGARDTKQLVDLIGKSMLAVSIMFYGGTIASDLGNGKRVDLLFPVRDLLGARKSPDKLALSINKAYKDRLLAKNINSISLVCWGAGA